MKEVWRDIKGYKGLYQVSNLGRVKSLPRLDGVKNQYRDIENILLGSKNLKGYLQVTLINSGIKKYHQMHRLVSIEFIKNIENKRTVNHIDGNKLNNCVSNLEWNTHSENHLHAFHVLGKQANKPWKGKFAYDNSSSKEVAAYHPNGELYKVYGSTCEAGRDGYIQSCVSACAIGKQSHHKNLIWKYV